MQPLMAILLISGLIGLRASRRDEEVPTRVILFLAILFALLMSVRRFL